MVGGGVAVTGFYTGSAILIGLILLILGSAATRRIPSEPTTFEQRPRANGGQRQMTRAVTRDRAGNTIRIAAIVLLLAITVALVVSSSHTDISKRCWLRSSSAAAACRHM